MAILILNKVFDFKSIVAFTRHY